MCLINDNSGIMEIFFNKGTVYAINRQGVWIDGENQNVKIVDEYGEKYVRDIGILLDRITISLK